MVSKIRPPRIFATADLSYEANLQTIIASTQAIFRDEELTLSFEQLYRASYKVVLSRHCKDLIDGIDQVMSRETERILTRQLPLELSFHGTSPNDSLTANRKLEILQLGFSPLEDLWEQHKLKVNMIYDVNAYAYRIAAADSILPSLDLRSSSIFASILSRVVFDSKHQGKTILDHFNSIILEQLEQDRCGDLVDRSSVKQLIDFLQNVSAELPAEQSLFLDFESVLISASQKFFEDESAIWMQHTTIEGYCRKTIQRLCDEDERCRLIMGDSTADKMGAVLLQQLVNPALVKLSLLENKSAVGTHDKQRQDRKLLEKVAEYYRSGVDLPQFASLSV